MLNEYRLLISKAMPREGKLMVGGGGVASHIAWREGRRALFLGIPLITPGEKSKYQLTGSGVWWHKIP
jgi:hypothetical protein